MSYFFLSLFGFAVSVALLYPTRRYVVLTKTHPWWMRFVGGVFAWSCVLSFCLFFVGFFMVAFHIVLGDGPPLAIYSYAMGFFLLYKAREHIPESFDWENMKEFIRESLFFNNYLRDHEDIYHKLDRHTVQRTHREIGGTQFPDAPDEDAEREKRLKEKIERLKILRQQPAPQLLSEELKKIQRGERTVLYESWMLYYFILQSPHPTYTLLTDLVLEPLTQILFVHLYFPALNEQELTTHATFFRLKQLVYDFLQAFLFERWTEQLQQYFSVLSVLCSASHYDDYGIASPYVCMKVTINKSELLKRSEMIFTGGDLQKIATIVFDNGKPISES